MEQPPDLSNGWTKTFYSPWDFLHPGSRLSSKHDFGPLYVDISIHQIEEQEPRSEIDNGRFLSMPPAPPVTMIGQCVGRRHRHFCPLFLLRSTDRWRSLVVGGGHLNAKLGAVCKFEGGMHRFRPS